MSRDDERGERPKRSWREIDARRNRSTHVREPQRPRGEAAQARAREASSSYLKDIEKQLFGKQKDDSEAERFAQALRAAHGTPELAAVCQAYQAAFGLPEDPKLLALFLDAREPALVGTALEAFEAARAAGRLSPTSGLRTQLRLLSQDSDDAVAEAALALLEQL